MEEKNLNVFEIFNHFDHSIAKVEPLSMKLPQGDLERIVEICNQKLIYDFLFRKKLQGEKYSLEKAKGFVNWANEGWVKGEYFVFLIRNHKDRIIGAIDIKSSNLESGEIGYWMDENARGFMTNAVIGLSEEAKRFGYKRLFALVRKENTSSARVVNRAGFNFIGDFLKNDINYDHFEKELI